MTFAQLPLHKKAIITEIKNAHPRLMEMGFIPGLTFELIEECPFKGTVILKSKYGAISLRREDVNMEVEILEKSTF